MRAQARDRPRPLGRHLTRQRAARRLWELRIFNPDRGPPSGIEALSRALASAQHDFEFVAGLYLGLKAALLTAYKRIVSECREILRLHRANALHQAAKSGASAA